MKFKTYKNLFKGIAVAQAVIAPGLILGGVLLKNKKLRNIGVIWCTAVTLDTARTTCFAIDNLKYPVEISDDEEI